MNCTDCLLDCTDACPRGAGRAVDDEICEEFFAERETMDRETRAVRCIEGHTEDYTDGFYAGNKAGIEASIMATRNKVVPETRKRTIEECLEVIKYCPTADMCRNLLRSLLKEQKNDNPESSRTVED